MADFHGIADLGFFPFKIKAYRNKKYERCTLKDTVLQTVVFLDGEWGMDIAF